MPDTAKHKRRAGRLGGCAPHKTRAHWTAGKRRNPPVDAGELSALIATLSERRLIAETARRLGVERSTIFRWSTGRNMPTPVLLAGLRRAVERALKIEN